MQPLSGLDAAFLYLETPQVHMHVAIAAVLDTSGMPGGYSFEKIVDVISSRVHLMPPFRRRLVQVPFDLHHPLWMDDPNFDIIHHVRRIGLPAPGGPKELGAMAGRIASTPLDRSRPLWECWIIEGLENDRVAVVAKVHHCAVDGASGAGLMVHLFDLQREVANPTPPKMLAVKDTALPTEWEMFKYGAKSRLKQPLQMFELAKRTVRAVSDVVKIRRDPEALVGAAPFTAPRTHFNTAVTAKRNVAFARVSLQTIKTIKNALGCTVNDVVLALCAGALRKYLQDRNELPKASLVAVCPISVRAELLPGESNNKVSAMFTSLATNIDDPAERLREIRKVTQGAKEEHNAIGANMLQNWAEFAAPTTFHVAARFYTRMKLAARHRPIMNLVISNVPGPPIPVYLAGAELVAVYPMGPVMEGAGLNITVMSYKGEVDFGFMVCADVMPDVWDLADAVPFAVEELLQSVTDLQAKEAESAASVSPST
jgi:diacylglycerol O-acyltransferase / wax synthase